MKKFRGIFIKTESEIELIKHANHIVSLVLDELEQNVSPGKPTIFFENLANNLCDQFNVKPAFKGYGGFPYALCCSVNEEIVHGFPSERVLLEGDIVSFDFGVIYKGFYGDSARTIAVGSISKQAEKLIDITSKSLQIGINNAISGNDLYDISSSVQSYAESFGMHVIKRFVGHGIGRSLHEKPEIPNFKPSHKEKIPLKTGMTLAIEPMLALGTDQVEIKKDRWTAVTKDSSLSAHFEHTIAITSNGPIILSC